MVKKPLTLSIVIPVYNEERYLKPCLDAIALQTVKPAEVIVIDNNSSDKSAEVAAAYPFVRLIKESNQGIVFARNAGFAAATSDIIGRIDADSVLPPSWVAQVTELMTDETVVGLTGPCHFYNHRFPTLAMYVHRLGYFAFSRLRMGSHALFGSNMAIRRSAWQQIDADVCNDNLYHEDTDISYHLSDIGIVRFAPSLRCQAESRFSSLPLKQKYHYMKRWYLTLAH